MRAGSKIGFRIKYRVGWEPEYKAIVADEPNSNGLTGSDFSTLVLKETKISPSECSQTVREVCNGAARSTSPRCTGESGYIGLHKKIVLA